VTELFAGDEWAWDAIASFLIASVLHYFLPNRFVGVLRIAIANLVALIAVITLSENLPLLIDAEPNTVSLLWVASYLASR
jgi:hypothetical protein